MTRSSNYYDVPVELKDNIDRILTRCFYNCTYVINGGVCTFETNADEEAFNKIIERAKAEKIADELIKKGPVTGLIVTEKEYENDWFVDAMLKSYKLSRNDIHIY